MTDEKTNENKAGVCIMGDCPVSFFRILLAAIIFAVVAQLSGWFIWGNLFMDELKELSHLWRPMESAEDKQQSLTYMFIGNFFIGLAVSLILAGLKKGYEGCPVQKGISFGIVLWLMLGVGKGLIWYSYTPIPLSLLYATLIDVAIFSIVGSVLVSLVLGKGSCKVKE